MKVKKTCTIIVVVSLVAVTASAFFAYLLSAQIQDIRKDNYITKAQSGYDIERIQFCLDQAISPCNDDSITAWNTDNPGTIYVLKSYQDLVEEGIAAYNASNR